MIRLLDWRNKLYPASLSRSNIRSKSKRARGRQVGTALRIEQFEDRRLLTISAVGVDSAYVEGIDPGNQTVATFSDPDGNPDPSLYDAQINWGDGTTTSGTVNFVGGTFFIVQGDHTYADEGSQIVSVDITDSADADSANNVTSTATVAENDTLLASTAAVAATEGSTFTGTVATFNDTTYPSNLASDLTATVDWGDGTTDVGTVSGGSGTFTVSGSHLYADEGSNPLAVTLTDDAPGTASATATGTATVVDAALSDSSAPATPTATEGASTGLLTVATFTDDNPGDHSADMTATIHWGDGTSTAGVAVTYNSGTYSVSDSHTYADEGSNPITVDVADTGGSTLTAIGQTTVTVVDAALSGASTATATGGVEDTTVATLAGATFTDANTAAPLSDFTVSAVDWGDGGTNIAGLSVSGSGGNYSVAGTHQYAEEGSHNFSITVTDDGGKTATITGTANVADAPLSGASTAAATGGTEGTTVATLTGATFTDANTSAPLSDFTVSAVDWGDGSTDTAGLSVSGSGGSYSVDGTHLYAEEGPHNFSITVTDDGGKTATITGTANVATVPIVATDTAVSGFEFTPLNNVTVATFTHANGLEPASEFTATIDWGDGTSSSGTVTLSGTNYSVSGSHTYSDEKSYSVTVRVVDAAASATIAVKATILEELLPGGTRGTADQRFISEVYRDLLDRGVDAGGLVYWAGILAQGTSRYEMVTELEATTEFENDEVNLLYEKYLHREVDASGLQYWAPMLAAGQSLEQVAAQIVGSPEYFQDRGQGTNDGFLDAIYQDALGRAPDSLGKAAFSVELSAGVSRTAVASQIFASDEYKRQVVQYVFSTLLDRPAEPAAEQGFAMDLDAGMTDEQLAANVAASDEFFAKTAN